MGHADNDIFENAALWVVQVRDGLTAPDFRLIGLTDFDKRYHIPSESDIRSEKKIS